MPVTLVIFQMLSGPMWIVVTLLYCASYIDHSPLQKLLLDSAAPESTPSDHKGLSCVPI